MGVIEWRDEGEKPKDDRDVLIRFEPGSYTVGYWDGDEWWLDCDGGRINGDPPEAWAYIEDEPLCCPFGGYGSDCRKPSTLGDSYREPFDAAVATVSAALGKITRETGAEVCCPPTGSAEVHDPEYDLRELLIDHLADIEDSVADLADQFTKLRCALNQE